LFEQQRGKKPNRTSADDNDVFHLHISLKTVCAPSV
jgi:hypothetical protein